jgi:zinc transport system substrate-binding protein
MAKIRFLLDNIAEKGEIAMKKFSIGLLSVFLLIGLVLTGCGKTETNQKKNDNQMTIYTTVYPLQYFAERIGGKYVTVHTVYPPGADEHTFEPTQKDIMKLVDADLFFYIGLGLEGFVDKAKESLKGEKVTFISTAESLPLDELKKQTAKVHAEGEDDHTNGEEHAEGEDEHTDGEEHAEGEDEHRHEIDPHVWLDPIYAQELARTIKNALVEKMPEQKDTFEKNYQELVNELQSLHQSFEKMVQSAERKEIIVAHAAYGYWQARYGIKQISISGLSTTNEPSQKQLEQVIAQAKQHKIKYILFEQNVSSKLAEIVGEEADAKPLTLHNLSVLTQENIDNNDTYFTIMKQNIATLQKALTQ